MNMFSQFYEYMYTVSREKNRELTKIAVNISNILNNFPNEPQADEMWEKAKRTYENVANRIKKQKVTKKQWILQKI